MKKILLVMFLAASIVTTHGQEKIKFQSMLQAGLLEGELGSSLQLHTVNGIRFKTWSAGVGAGLDYYHTRSIPVFLDLRKRILRNPQSPFLYAGGGYHFPWEKKQTDQQWGYYYDRNTSGGLYYDAGIGYQLPVKNSMLYFTAGYTYKRFSQEVPQPVMCITWPCPEVMQTFDYQVRRLSVKTGLRF
ncbi:MAG TPA: hypothetical protein VFZ78_11665 [Flavisolibacter sp.]